MADLWRGQVGGGDDKERVKDACDIVRIIGEHLAIKPKGREYVCLCPFHDDHNPSMRIVPAKQIFHCFVCGAGGDVFTFAMKFHKMEFREALEFLAEKSGVELTPREQRQAASADGAPELSRRHLLEACDAGSKFFQQILKHQEHGATARAVIEKRGISSEMVEQFMLGAAPDRWDGLVLTATQRGVPLAALIAAGLAKPRERGDGAYDMLRSRLIFPIHDKAGRVVAFGGRKLKEEDEPKYLNSPETRLFNKSATLYALHLAARAIQAEKCVLITEGYMDVIACHQAGFRNAVATLGTALTTEHAAVLRPICDTAILLFDGDDAGQRAADRAVPIFFAEPIDVRIATLGKFTDAKDPDELLKRPDGPAVFRRVLAEATDLLEYRFARVRAKLAGAGVSALSKAILSEIEALVDMGLRRAEPVRQKLIVKRLAQLGGLDEATILNAIPAGRPGRTFSAPASDDQPLAPEEVMPNIGSAALRIEEYLLGCLLCDPALWNAMGEREKDLISPREMRWEPLRRIAQCALDLAEDGFPPALSKILSMVDDPAAQAAAVGLSSRVERETEASPDRLHAFYRECVTRSLLDHHRGQQGRNIEIEPKNAAVRVSDGVAERLQKMRDSHAGLPPDRRILPRRRG